MAGSPFFYWLNDVGRVDRARGSARRYGAWLNITHKLKSKKLVVVQVLLIGCSFYLR